MKLKNYYFIIFIILSFSGCTFLKSYYVDKAHYTCKQTACSNIIKESSQNSLGTTIQEIAIIKKEHIKNIEYEKPTIIKQVKLRERQKCIEDCVNKYINQIYDN